MSTNDCLVNICDSHCHQGMLVVLYAAYILYIAHSVLNIMVPMYICIAFGFYTLENITMVGWSGFFTS